MLYIKYAVTFALAIRSSIAVSYLNERKCDHPVIARLPPSEGKPNPKFKDTTRGYFSGQYYQTHNSEDLKSLEAKNFQLISAYEVSSDTTSDITSYQIGDCPHVYTVFAKDRHVTNSQGDDFPLIEPGTNITHYNDILAYGRDTKCHLYFVVYARTDFSTPSLSISSSVQEGPSSDTLEAIKKALIKLGNKKLTKLVKSIQKVPDDGKRLGLADFICDHNCMTNKNSPPTDGSCPS